MGKGGYGDDAGGLVGENWSFISHCYAKGSISGRINVGGLVGNNAGTILACYSTGGIDGHMETGGLVGSSYGSILYSYATGDVWGGNANGGLVGENEWHTSTIKDCYATGDVSGTGVTVGGLVEENRGKVLNSYTNGTISGNTMGGFVGYDYDGFYSKCFWDGDINPGLAGIVNSFDPNVIKESTSNMRKESTFTDAGWDFVGEIINGNEDIWTIDEGLDYPRLWWENIDPVELLVELMDYINGLELQQGIANSLLVKIEAVLEKLEDENINNNVAAINILQALINAVEAQRGKKISEADANSIIAAAQEIIELLRSENALNKNRQLGRFAKDWLQTGSNMPSDINQDKIVNFRDFAVMAQKWMAEF